MLIDEYKPTGTTADRQRMQREAEIVLRAQGNRSGRGRMRADTTLRPSKPPRGIVIATGEETVHGQSLLARVPTIEVARGDVKKEKLNACQAHARTDCMPKRWPALSGGSPLWPRPRLTKLKRGYLSGLPAARAKVRDAHRRTGDTYLQLCWAWNTFVQFARETGAITDDEAAALQGAVAPGLAEFSASQARYQGSDDPVSRYFEQLIAAVGSGPPTSPRPKERNRSPRRHGGGATKWSAPAKTSATNGSRRARG